MYAIIPLHSFGGVLPHLYLSAVMAKILHNVPEEGQLTVFFGWIHPRMVKIFLLNLSSSVFLRGDINSSVDNGILHNSKIITIIKPARNYL